MPAQVLSWQALQTLMSTGTMQMAMHTLAIVPVVSLISMCVLSPSSTHMHILYVNTDVSEHIQVPLATIFQPPYTSLSGIIMFFPKLSCTHTIFCRAGKCGLGTRLLPKCRKRKWALVCIQGYISLFTWRVTHTQVNATSYVKLVLTASYGHIIIVA